MTPATQLDGIELKLRQLHAKVDRQRAQYQSVVADNERLQRELDRQQGLVTSLRDKLAQATPSSKPAATTKVPAVAPAAPPTTPVDTTAQRETIAYCLQEIDRCLDWLHRN